MTNSIETFDRISVFLKTTNSALQLKRANEQIYYSLNFHHNGSWQIWYADLIASRFKLEDLFEHFLLADENTLWRHYTLRQFIMQLLYGFQIKDNSLIELYSIGQPVSLEEWNIKLDLIGA